VGGGEGGGEISANGFIRNTSLIVSFRPSFGQTPEKRGEGEKKGERRKRGGKTSQLSGRFEYSARSSKLKKKKWGKREVSRGFYVTQFVVCYRDGRPAGGKKRGEKKKKEKREKNSDCGLASRHLRF